MPTDTHCGHRVEVGTRAHQASFEAFGHIDFKSEVANRPQGGGSPTEYAMFNEHTRLVCRPPVQARLRTAIRTAIRTRLRIIGGVIG